MSWARCQSALGSLDRTFCCQKLLSSDGWDDLDRDPESFDSEVSEPGTVLIAMSFYQDHAATLLGLEEAPDHLEASQWLHGFAVVDLADTVSL